MEDQKKKIWPTILSWCYLALSLIVPIFVPEAGQKASIYNITNIYKIITSTDYRLVMIVVGYLVLAFAIVYGIDFYNKKYRGYSPSPDESEKELRSGLRSLWLMLETGRVYAIILGTIVLIARLLGFNLLVLLR